MDGDALAFDWDDANRNHLARHGVTPEEAEQAILDPHLIVGDIEEIGDEERNRVIGMTRKGRILTVAFTFRQQAVRVVTAFDAIARDQNSYLEARKAQ